MSLENNATKNYIPNISNTIKCFHQEICGMIMKIVLCFLGGVNSKHVSTREMSALSLIVNGFNAQHD